MTAPAPARISMLAPFSAQRFRYQWSADLLTAWALEMEVLILGWYVLVESGSVRLLTLYAALMYVGTLLSPLLGTVGDRFGLPRLLMLMRTAYAVAALVLLGLAAVGALSPKGVLVLALGVGLLKPSDIGMRSALVATTVPAAQLVAAMSVSRTTQDSARIGGALAGAGAAAAFGMVPAYCVILLLYLLSVGLTWRAGRLGAKQNHPAVAATNAGAAKPTAQAPPPSPWRSVAEGLLTVWRTPPLLAAMAVAALVNLTAFPLTGGLMPYVARDVFGLDQKGLGWMVACWACGALCGSLLLSVLGPRLRAGRTMLVCSVVWHLMLTGLALPVGLAGALVMLAAAGLFQSLSMLSLSVILMRITPEPMRGRIMGVRMLAIYTLPIGLLAAGWLIPAWGFGGLVTGSVVLGILVLAAIAWRWREHLMDAGSPANGRQG
jgi:MFS family permease